MSTITAKDLTKEYPRAPYEELGGFPWLPRLIDKVRALKAGKIGEYTPFPCGGDQRFLAVTGLDPAALKAEIDRGASDEEIAAWVKAHVSPDAMKKVDEYRGQLDAPIAGGEYLDYLNGAKAELAKARPDLDINSIKNFTHLICAEEGYPYPRR